ARGAVALEVDQLDLVHVGARVVPEDDHAGRVADRVGELVEDEITVGDVDRPGDFEATAKGGPVDQHLQRAGAVGPEVFVQLAHLPRHRVDVARLARDLGFGGTDVD